MLRSLRVGRMFGIDVFVHWSFWILPVIFVVATRSFGWVKTPLALAFVFLVFSCVVFHEYGHALTARLFGIRTRDIVLFPLGGIARLERMSEEPIEEIIISVAGPAVNVVLGVLLLVGLWLFGYEFQLPPRLNDFTGIGRLVEAMMYWNFGMVFFNLAPAFPMDGGRVLRAFIALFVDRITATRVAVYIGSGMAGLFILFGLLGSYMFILIGVFVLVLGPLELAMLRRQEQMRHQARVEASWQPNNEAIVPIPPAEPNFSGYTWDPHLSSWIEWRNGRPVRQCRMRV